MHYTLVIKTIIDTWKLFGLETLTVNVVLLMLAVVNVNIL